MENKVTKTPCKICEKNNKGARYYPEALCCFRQKNSEEEKRKEIIYK